MTRNILFTGSPRPKLGQSYSTEASVGDTTVIEMDLDAYPRPEYTWVRQDGRPVRGSITSDDHFTRVEIQNVQIEYELTYLHIHESDC